jgi:hypothetical protein
MATMEDIVSGYINDWFQNPTKSTALKIVENINSLKYEKDGEKLKKEDIDKLLNLLRRKLQEVQKSNSNESEFLVLKRNYGHLSTASTDTSEFNDLINIILSGTKK